MIRLLFSITILFVWGLIIFVRSEPFNINFFKTGLKGNCSTFTSPIYKSNDGDSFFEARTQRTDLTLKEVIIFAKEGTIKCVAWFDVYTRNIRKSKRYHHPSYNLAGAEEFKISGRRGHIKRVTFSTNLEIVDLLRIDVFRSAGQCKKQRLRIFAVALSLEIGEMCCHCDSTENCQNSVEIDPRSMPLKKCPYFWNGTNDDCDDGEESDKPWSKWTNFFSVIKHVSDASTGKNETKKDMSAVSRESLITGAAIGGGLSLIIFSIVVCILIRKLRQISNRRIQIRRSQLRSSLFIFPGNHTASSITRGQRTEDMPDVLDVNNRKFSAANEGQQQQLSTQRPVSDGSHIYAEPADYGSVPESNQTENEIYSPASEHY